MEDCLNRRCMKGVKGHVKHNKTLYPKMLCIDNQWEFCELSLRRLLIKSWNMQIITELMKLIMCRWVNLTSNLCPCWYMLVIENCEIDVQSSRIVGLSIWLPVDLRKVIQFVPRFSQSPISYFLSSVLLWTASREPSVWTHCLEVF